MRTGTNGRIGEAGCAVGERENTDSSVVVADCVVLKRAITVGCIGLSDGVTQERLETNRRIVEACVANKRIVTQNGVVIR